MTIPGTQGAAAVFGGTGAQGDYGDGRVDFERNLIEEIKKKRMLQQAAMAAQTPVGMGSDPAQMLSNPMAPQLQQAAVMRDIMPSAEMAGGNMDNPLAGGPVQSVQMPQGVGAGPNPLGAGPSPLPATPPPPPMEQSPLQRAMADVPKPGKRGFGGALKEGLSSMLHGKGLIQGLTGDYAKNKYKRDVAEKAGIYGEEANWRDKQNKDLLEKAKANLETRKQGETEKQNERMYGAKMTDAQARREQAEERAGLAERKFEESVAGRERDRKLAEEKFLEAKAQFEQKLQRQLTDDENDQLYREAQLEIARQNAGTSAASVGVSAGNLRQRQKEFEEEQRRRKEGFVRGADGQWFKERDGNLYEYQPINPNPIMRER